MDNKNRVFVDSCVLLDIFNDDKTWFEWSSGTLHEISKENQLVINIIVFTEIAINFDSSGKLRRTLELLNIKILDIPTETGFNVSRVFRKYKRNQGDKKSVMPDFYIGEHAKYLNIPLVTRDIARFKTYQPNLRLISPNKTIINRHDPRHYRVLRKTYPGRP